MQTLIAWIAGLVFVFGEEQRTYDPNTTYQVNTYRRHRSGSSTLVNSRMESGDALIQKEITRMTTIRVFGFLFLGATVVGTLFLTARIGRGEKVFQDAFKN